MAFICITVPISVLLSGLLRAFTFIWGESEPAVVKIQKSSHCCRECHRNFYYWLKDARVLTVQRCIGCSAVYSPSLDRPAYPLLFMLGLLQRGCQCIRLLPLIPPQQCHLLPISPRPSESPTSPPLCHLNYSLLLLLQAAILTNEPITPFSSNTCSSLSPALRPLVGAAYPPSRVRRPH